MGPPAFGFTCPTDINIVNKGLGCKNEQKLQIENNNLSQSFLFSKG